MFKIQMYSQMAKSMSFSKNAIKKKVAGLLWMVREKFQIQAC